MKKEKNKLETIYSNRKARFDFEILETFEAGLVLEGPEVKSLRAKQVNMSSSFARVEKDGIYLYGMQILPYKFNTLKEIDPLRTRKLLLNRQEIKKLKGASEQKGYTLVPLELYFKNGWAKVSLAVAKGKKTFDKKEKIKERDLDRETRREMKGR
ncbi:MAG: SsrA-binding protein [Elusimicrobia bacterium CG08_land_8_20_14_0_20_51_18]|nr:MAG: SsrA-binding protein [Elusimicrobia bacterium CG08_land_8_20_14_0_20_51_18]